MGDEVEAIPAGSQPASGATADSPTASTTAGDSSPQAEHAERVQTPPQPETISDALNGVKLEEPATEEPVTGTDSEKPEVKTSEETVPEAEAEKDDKPADKGTETADPDVPFHSRPEWSEAVKIGGDKIKPVLRKILQSERVALARVRTLEPDARITAELRLLTGDEKGFEGTRNLIRFFSDDPVKAVPMLKTLLADAEQRSGISISSPDLVQRSAVLKTKLEQGEIDQAEFDAQSGLLREAEKGRAGKRQAETRLTQTEQQRRQQEFQQRRQEEERVLNDWETNMRTREPDFGDVTGINDPKHGESIADQVLDAALLLRTNDPKATTQQVMGAMDRAFKLAKSRLKPGTTPRERTVLTTERSSVTAKARPKNWREALDQVRLE